MEGVFPHDHGELARNTTGSRTRSSKGTEARSWMNARKGRPVRITGAQGKLSRSRRWDGRLESFQEA